MEGNVGKFSEGEGSMAEGENSIYMWWRAEASSPENCSLRYLRPDTECG